MSAYDGWKLDSPPRYNDNRTCECGSGLTPEWVYDGNNIPLCKVCPSCKREKLSSYRQEILAPYSQINVDEPIEPEE